jgi:hypothetical protein
MNIRSENICNASFVNLNKTYLSSKLFPLENAIFFQTVLPQQ